MQHCERHRHQRQASIHTALQAASNHRRFTAVAWKILPYDAPIQCPAMLSNKTYVQCESTRGAHDSGARADLVRHSIAGVRRQRHFDTIVHVKPLWVMIPLQTGHTPEQKYSAKEYITLITATANLFCSHRHTGHERECLTKIFE